MKLIFNLILIWIVSNQVFAEIGDITKINLKDDVDLQIEEILPARNLPHIYYDQALESIRAIYPGAHILTKRRYGRISNLEHFAYSMVSYLETDEALNVKVGGIFRVSDRAWKYSTEIPKNKYTDINIIILERIAEYAF